MSQLQDFLNSSIPDVSAMRVKAKAGDLYGIELECEGRNVEWDQKTEEILRNWTPHHDGSLRANHGGACEWVFTGPAKYDASVKRVHELFDYFDKSKAKLVCSNRTSTHIHFNVGDKNAYQVVNLYILFTIFEGLLDRYCGEERVGNLFCLSSRHAEQQLEWVMRACFKDHSFARIGNEQRYCSLNLNAINKFGTVEFRGMRGLDNREDLLAWLSIVNELCTYACYTMKNPVDVLQAISQNGPTEFMKQIWSAQNVRLLVGGVSEQQLSYSIYEGLRLVQMLCYKIGTEFDQVRLRGPDFWASFGKERAEPEIDLKKVADELRQGRVEKARFPRPPLNPLIVNHRRNEPAHIPQEAIDWEEAVRQVRRDLGARRMRIDPIFGNVLPVDDEEGDADRG
jgi:hypothetical protein